MGAGPGRDIAAKPTFYRGQWLKSRLEARWAVAMDFLHVRWEYERRWFKLPCGKYSPDFYIPDARVWIEIKPTVPYEEERRKAREIASETGEPVFILYGDFPMHPVEYGGGGTKGAHVFFPDGVERACEDPFPWFSGEDRDKMIEDALASGKDAGFLNEAFGNFPGANPPTPKTDVEILAEGIDRMEEQLARFREVLGRLRAPKKEGT